MKTPEKDLVPLETCRCEEILETVFRPLAYHFLALGENNKALYYFLEIVSAYLTLGDNYMVSISAQPPSPLNRPTHRHRARREALCAFLFLWVLNSRQHPFPLKIKLLGREMT